MSESVASDPPRHEPPPSADVALLRKLGYEQQLYRGLRTIDNVAMGFAAISPVVALYGVVGIGLILAGPRLGVGAAAGAGGSVPGPRGVRRGRVGVPDRERVLPVEPAAGRAGLRLVQRLGRALFVRRRQRHDRLPRRTLGADARRHRGDAERDRGDGLRARRRLLAGQRTRAGLAADRGPDRHHRRVDRICRRRTGAAAAVPRAGFSILGESLGAEARRVARGPPPWWRHSRSAAGCSSASTPAG